MSSSSSSTPEPSSKRKRAAILDEDVDEDASFSSSGSDSEPQRKAKTETNVDDADSDSDPDLDEEADIDVDAPPPLSHAEKRRQKKREKLAEKQGGEPAKKKCKLADGKAKASDSEKQHPRRQNSVWVGNLSYKTTPEALKVFFDGVGEITRINMPTKPSGKPGMKGDNRGFAYVDFSSPDAKTIAITLSERPLNGRKLLIKDGDNFEGRPKPAVSVATPETPGDHLHLTNKSSSLSKTAQKILSLQKQPPAPTLFLGNLPFETTEDSLRDLLDAHHPKANGDDKDKHADEGQQGAESKKEEDWIRRIRLAAFEDSGQCKGFAFVDFSSIENATSALVNPRNHNFNGRKLVVEYASPEAVKRGPNKPKTEGWNANSKAKGPRGNRHDRDDQSKKFDRKKESGGRSKEGWKDHEDGIDANISDEKEHGKSGTKAKWDRGEMVGKNSKGRRPKPGAALAQAVRQSAAIITNSNTESKKIVFGDD